MFFTFDCCTRLKPYFHKATWLMLLEFRDVMEIDTTDLLFILKKDFSLIANTFNINKYSVLNLLNHHF